MNDIAMNAISALMGRTIKPSNNKLARGQRELLLVADRCAELAAIFEQRGLSRLANQLVEACDTIQESWSGSNFGYQANVYYEKFEPPPPSAHFSPEWGIREDSFGFGHGSHPGFREYAPKSVRSHLLSPFNEDEIADAETRSSENFSAFATYRRDAVSILMAASPDAFLQDILQEIKDIPVLTVGEAKRALLPTGSYMSRDSLAVSQGRRLAPHQDLWADAFVIASSGKALESLATLVRQAAAHMDRMLDDMATTTDSKKVFVGHGRSMIWRELKDFLRDTLHAETEEFNQVPTAGISTTSRLFQMLDECGFALLIMTAEDDAGEGRKNARLNVIHEIGLFQGRLGPSKAIVMLEEGCEEFSNIHGLGQIRFTAGNIRSAFEDVRSVLKRERIIN